MAAIWGAAIAAVGSFFSGKSKNKKDAQLQKNQFYIDKYLAELQRNYTLQDRRYSEEAIGAYRGYAKPGLMSPQYTDPNTVKPVDPYAPKPKG